MIFKERASALSFIFIVRYHYEKPAIYLSMYGNTYECDHPVYSKCTLFKEENRGIAVIQQRYNKSQKSTWWGEIDPWLTDTIYLSPGFKELLEARACEAIDGLYPTIAIRQLMWALKMKPLPKERWETCFDRKNI